MEKWELAVNKFLDEYKNQDYFVGAILTGSYATGNQNEKEYDKRFECVKKIYEFFRNEFNSFDINNFSLRSDVE